MSAPRVVRADERGVVVHVDGDGERFLNWGELRHGTTCPHAATAAKYSSLLAEAEKLARRAA